MVTPTPALTGAGSRNYLDSKFVSMCRVRNASQSVDGMELGGLTEVLMDGGCERAVETGRKIISYHFNSDSADTNQEGSARSDSEKRSNSARRGLFGSRS